MTVDNQTPVVGKRYLLTGKLGAGGMGSVYRATDRLTGQMVALKRVTAPTEQLLFASKPSDSNADLYLALAHEFQTLSSLRHPYIISVLDYGFDAHNGQKRQPYFTMDYVAEAKSITDVGKALTVQERLRLVVQLLQALVYLHRRSVLHRDLKPANILVDNSQVRLVDFGLAASSTLSGKFASETAAGTFAYMAPELFQEGIASRASDLYAVGIVLYELLEGRHPFDVRNPAMLIQAILNTRPDVYSVTDNEALSAVLDRLLRKDPAERYQDAAEVIRELCQAANLTYPLETAEIREGVLQKAQFVGRDAELTLLTESLKSLSSNTGALWLVGGESGVGKSRLLNEFRIRALTEGVIVLQGQTVSEGGSPYLVWRDLLRWLVLLTDLTDLEAGILKPLMPDIETLIGRAVPEVSTLASQQARDRLFGTIEAILRRQELPLAVMLEDLQWADEESLALLTHLSEVLQSNPILFLTTYRDDEAPDLPKRLPAMKLLKLHRLDQIAIAELSEAMLGAAGRDRQVVSLLARETEGNLFFLVEVVRALAEEAGQIENVGATTLPAQVITGGIGRFVQRRLNRVLPEHYAILQAAAVAGRQIDHELLRAMCPTENIDSWLADCANAAILEIQENRWRFVHDKLREGLLTTLPGTERQELHRQVAQTTKQLHGNDPQYVNVLAYHFYEGQQWGHAVDYLSKAGLAASKLNALSEARLHFARAVKALTQLPDSDDNRRRRADMLLRQVSASYASENPDFTLGQLQEAETLLNTLLAANHAHRGDNLRLARVQGWIGRTHFLRNQLPKALHYFQQLYALAEESGDEVALGIPAFMIGQILNNQGWFGKSVTFLSQALDPLEKSGNWNDWIIAASLLGVSLAAMGQYSNGLANAERALLRATEIDSPMGQIVSHIELARIYGREGGDLSAALKHLYDAITLGEKAGELSLLYVAYGAKGWAETGLNKRQDARTSFKQAQAIAQTLGGHVYSDHYIAAFEAEISLSLGQVEDVLARSPEVVAYAQSIGGVEAEGYTHRTWGQALAALNPPHWEEAETHLAVSLQLVESGEGWLEAARTHIAWGEVCRDRGNVTAARDHFEKAANQFEASKLYALLDRVKTLIGQLN